MQTGQELLSYHGDAALAGGNPQGYTPDVAGALNPFHQTLQKVYENMARWNVMKFQQGIKDRDELYNQMSQTELPSEMLDEDREELSGKISGLKDKLLKNFDYASKNPKGMIETQNDIKKIKEGINTAKTRWALITQKRLDYRDNPDPTYRTALGEEITKDIKGGAYKMPAPYVRPDYYEPTVFANPTPSAIGVPEIVDHNGFKFKRQTVGTPFDDFYRYYGSAAAPNMSVGNGVGPSSIATLAATTATMGAKDKKAAAAGAQTQQSGLKPWQIGTAYQFHGASEDYMNDEHLLSAGVRLKEIMAENNIHPGDPRYIDHLAEKGADGEWKLIADPVKWAIGQSLVANYHKTVQEAPDKDLQAMDKLRAGAIQSRAAANLSNVKASLEPAKVQSMIDKNAAQAEAYKKKGNYDQAKQLLLTNTAMEPVTETISKFGNILKQDNFKTGAELNVPAAVYGQLGIDKSWAAAPVTKDATIISMMSTPEFNQDKVSGNKKATGGYVQPYSVIALKSPDGDPNKTKLVALDRQFNVSKIVSANQAWEEIIKHQSGYKLTNNTVKMMGAGRMAVQQLQGTDAQGLDLNAILDSKQVVNTDMNVKPGWDKSKELNGKVYYRYPGANGSPQWLDADGKQVEP